MKHIINKYLLVTLIAAIPYLAYADVPNTISFQGYLSDDSGNAVNGTTDITFSIVDTDWNEEHNNVPVNNGVFSVQLGSETAFGSNIDFSKAPKWLEITFENGSSQRVELSSVPYAFHAKTVETNNWPQGNYCILQAGGSCPKGFTGNSAYMRAIRLYSGNSNYIKESKFGDSSINCHGGCGQYGQWTGELHLKVCCK
ncbi:hypothetical protein [Candidatus Marithrix sp. Canyon 246]|uniref:hypothetical protein n=1 Tax=Candidatus Marithrix sp. Canyon 246 TaxID=1827136 RepID=UPI00084A148C|nr:hypothetical protein [Candidatus Marithrix sp. Canyon 246]